MVILGSVNEHHRRFLFEAGSAISLISSAKMIDTLGFQTKPLSCPPAVSVAGKPIQLHGKLQLQLKLGELHLKQLLDVIS